MQAPEQYSIQYLDGKTWRDVSNSRISPLRPAGGQFNEASFDPVTTDRIRVVFTHRGKARSGVSEILIWRE